MAREFYASGEIMSSNSPTTSNTHHHNHRHHHQHHQHEMVNHQIQGFDDTNPPNQHQIFGSMNTNMGMIDFSKQHHNHHHHHHHNHQISVASTGLEETSTGGGENLFLEDSSISSSMRCSNVNNFTCEVNGERRPLQTSTRRPNQGLSLSLSSPNPSAIISLHQPFQLRPQTHQEQPDDDHALTTRVVGSSRQGYFGAPYQNQPAQMMMMMMMMNSNTSDYFHHQQQHQNHDDQFQVGRSRYLGPAQELLNEFCSLGTKQSDEEIRTMKQKGKQRQQQLWETRNNNDNNGNDHHHQSASTSSTQHVPPLHSLEFMELQKRKSKLVSMLDEIVRRYHQYREQMRAAVAAFEASVGNAAADTYTALASKAMSRHFRCLRDAVVEQIQATKKAMGERSDHDPGASGASGGSTRGETPRLRLLDQAFRQQKVYRQMGIVDAHPWRPQRGLPDSAVSVLRAWLFEHFLHPYPSDVDKHILARQTGLSRSQVSNWFINARVRLWKPMIEEMYSEETRGEQCDNNQENAMVNPLTVGPKPEPNHMDRPVDPDSLSSIIASRHSSKPDRTTSHLQGHRHHQGTTSSFVGSTFDFSLYGHHNDVSTIEDGATRGVSLTLGLQRHDADGAVSLAFSSAAAQGGPLYYGREHIEDCQQQGSIQYPTSLLDGDQAQTSPYRNLMGAQLLHDIV